jgi:hypothetical protein
LKKAEDSRREKEKCKRKKEEKRKSFDVKSANNDDNTMLPSSSESLFDFCVIFFLAPTRPLAVLCGVVSGCLDVLPRRK